MAAAAFHAALGSLLAAIEAQAASLAPTTPRRPPPPPAGSFNVIHNLDSIGAAAPREPLTAAELKTICALAGRVSAPRLLAGGVAGMFGITLQGIIGVPLFEPDPVRQAQVRLGVLVQPSASAVASAWHVSLLFSTKNFQ